ncbi:histidine phosphatase family protein [Roseateles amylovorans]|jgi:phosphohistidine phosphatase SixA|uniref:Histidine phosphatase family protein n=1 Tax=Roseateles amylovorans TaxID=2978473 RepID=A0ABY6B5Y1_9BURK|nr:histidine phosphatase family protein [Roseateles amylovorans]UXH79935.1 histidine phosphatase family protein [Roseateles amylovorans]
MDRRQLLALSCAVSATLASRVGFAESPPPAAAGAEALALLKRGGVVLAMRHARAPGTFDPPGFKLGECSTQRNLSEDGRHQARALGQRLKAAGLTPAQVRSSPWCRCMDTATLAFGRVQAWPALGSPEGVDAATYAQSLDTLRRSLAEAARRPGEFEVWVTHMFVLSALVNTDTASAEGLVLGLDAKGQPTVLARLETPYR